MWKHIVPRVPPTLLSLAMFLRTRRKLSGTQRDTKLLLLPNCQCKRPAQAFYTNPSLTIYQCDIYTLDLRCIQGQNSSPISGVSVLLQLASVWHVHSQSIYTNRRYGDLITPPTFSTNPAGIEFVCPSCDSGAGILDPRTIRALLGMGLVTALTAAWFIAGVL